jgi:hypothetical protein
MTDAALSIEHSRPTLPKNVRSNNGLEPGVLRSRTTAIAMLLVVSTIGLILLPPGSALANTSSDSSDGTGIEVASWALTVPYVIGKGTFALGGAVVGGLGYVFSGGNVNTAKSVWTRSIYGTYIIRPAHLRGEEPVHFFGQPDESPNEAVTHQDSRL